MLPVTEVRIDSLRAHPRNYKYHPEAQISRIVQAFERYDQYKNIVTWKGFILAGHGVVEGARAAGRETVGVVDVSHLSETEALALLAWDNESPRGAVDAEDVLASLVAELVEADEALAELAAGTEERLKELLAGPFGDTSTDREGQAVSSTWQQVKAAQSGRVIIGELESRLPQETIERLIQCLVEEFETADTSIHETLNVIILTGVAEFENRNPRR